MRRKELVFRPKNRVYFLACGKVTINGEWVRLDANVYVWNFDLSFLNECLTNTYIVDAPNGSFIFRGKYWQARGDKSIEQLFIKIS